ncbi:DUF3090 family protein [Mumia sp. zg.B53]|uniref:DUF3090 family protein n=1 Tax=unclassified Mumia TaxID=2621872 RepID=UPI001C6F1212|nr:MULTISPECIES: DUF3090 family protein [unclassified Mumia]MBW9205105.1 DUF3090 family protein [Mumia sp. zg.B17]MBW9208891.1 DUF3090 family protein [Mumia sp. zg.B21]MBW9213503.1 DUF3090 family protein [Mumia sp. zg.B53]MDD9348923.1 DUF3090 family protein [Mumia sp.]
MLIHRFERPRRFVAGTVGAPGERTFFLQASDGGRVTSVALEKEQVLVLAERLEALLVEVGGDAGSGTAPERTVDLDPLDQPIEEEFRVGTMTLAWEPEAGEIVVEAFAATEDEDTEASDMLVVTLRPEVALEFAERAKSVVAAGRPTCPFCGGVVEAEGHLCPRANGFRRVARE